MATKVNGSEMSTSTDQPSSSSDNRQQQRLLRTGICYSRQMLKHWKPGTSFDYEKDQDDDDLEPERPSRIARVIAQVSKQNLIANLENIKIRQATKEEIMLVHSEGHWNRIHETAFMSSQDLKDRASYFSRLSLYVNADTFDCARLSCGGVIEMCRAVVEGRIKNGFAIVRPPGHHSEPEDPSGFCIFNNAAVSAKWLRTIYPDKIRKILMIDWDVHHGNGIQRSFYFDSSVLYISIHRYLENNRTSYFYPGSDWGGSNRVGEGEGRGFNVNIPWPDAGMGDQDYIYAFQRLVMPIAMEFNPDFVIVSAGFDAAKNDPLGECDVTPEGFAHMTHMVTSLANGKVVLALEGGYHLESLAVSATECIKVLMGEAPPKVEKGLVASDTATETIDECLKIQSEFWKCLPKGVTSRNEVSLEGFNTPLADVLKLYRSYDLYHTHGLCNVPMRESSPAALANSYRNQIMVSENVYECKTLVLFLHDLGNIRNEVFVEPTSMEKEKEAILDCNSLIMDWINRKKYGVIDAQILPSFVSDLVTDGLTKKVEQNKLTKLLISWLWNSFISLSDCEDIVLICVGESCNFLNTILTLKDVSSKLAVSIQIPNVRHIPSKLSSDLQWYYDISAAFVPVIGESSRLYDRLPQGVFKLTDKTRPSQLIHLEWKTISDLIERKLKRKNKGGPEEGKVNGNTKENDQYSRRDSDNSNDSNDILNPMQRSKKLNQNDKIGSVDNNAGENLSVSIRGNEMDLD
ncbi:hypothetical protein BY996DRAFT_7125185 [Phakopsora pachyrhizi]|uniref:histone deacetylase n=1 Tax=Phakopsora pachyrhizi TaxID=170000 RepID=A0AAV0BSG2_PHAPC|nr:hypothetical protein BY996DRAFT_7125185 [Phakopsora pachyrhizi]CAH7689737.1 hypothetical protein PPACK8108_LOCUS24864 [Phakopsora pachyrhizi]